MDEERLLKDLQDLLRRQVDRDDQWEAYCAGELSEQEEAALLARAENAAAKGEPDHREAYRPLGAEFQRDMVAHMQARLQEQGGAEAGEESPGAWARLVAWLGAHRQGAALATAACAAALVAALVWDPAPTAVTPRPDVVTIKGTHTLRVYCKRGQRQLELQSGDRVQARDALRLELFSHRLPYVLALGIEAGGKVSVYAPWTGARSHKITPDKATVLPDSVILDDSPHDELLVVLLSSKPLSVATAREAANRAYREAGRDLRRVTGLGAGEAAHLVHLLTRERTRP